MTLDEYLLLGLVQYGLPVLFGVILPAAVGLPLPATLLLITAGSFIAQGELQGWAVVALALSAAVMGDLLGYTVGRWGSTPLVARLSRWGGGEERVRQAEAVSRRWGGIGIFLSRWLLTPLGPVVNLTSGITRYPLPAFLAFDVAGEALWVGLYVGLGWMFSDQIQDISEALSDVTGLAFGLVMIAVLLYLLRYAGADDSGTR
jgi:membrane-associated protein